MSARVVVTDLAARINDEHQRAYGMAKEALEHARRCGELLVEAKQAVGHGGWATWLAQNISFTDRTARRYMALAQNWSVIEGKSDTVSDLTLRGALAEIKKKGWLDDIERQRQELENHRPTVPDGLFDVIAIDPPWPYGESIDVSGYDPAGHRASNPYPEMSLDDIRAIELPAADDCVLWLWTTHRFMRHAFPILDSWGFEDKAILTWVKDRMGLGRWLRSQSEFCIMAVRGSPLITLTNQTTVLRGPMREHSRKPDEFYALVESLCAGRKLDYFSREKRQGWEQFGNDPARFGLAAA